MLILDEFMKELAILHDTIDKLSDGYPDSLVFIRGDANASITLGTTTSVTSCSDTSCRGVPKNKILEFQTPHAHGCSLGM